MSRRECLAVFAMLAALASAEAARAQRNAADAQLDLLHVQGNVYMLHGGEEGNIAVQVGADGVLLVNAMRQGLAEPVAAKIATLTTAPIRYIVNTSDDLHYTGGNAELAAKGMFGASNVGPRPGATIVAHENVSLRLTELTGRNRDPFPFEGLPLDVYFVQFKDVYFNGEPVFVMHQPRAHTDGDSIVLFRKSDTIAVGDLFIPGEYPAIDIERGGSVQGLLAGLDRLLDLAVPERLQDGGTRIVPGRGRLCNEADVVEYRNMVAIVRDRVRDLMTRGLTLEEIQAARPTFDYDTEYRGRAADFIESVHASLTGSE